MKATAINDVIPVVIAAVSGVVDYQVFDGPPSKRPGREVDRWVAIGAENVNEPDPDDGTTESARMTAVISGLGQTSRKEEMDIPCVAVGKSTTITAARAIAAAVVEDVSQSLPKHPTALTYGAQVSEVTAVRSKNTSGGAVVQISFVIAACARLT